MNRLNKIVIVCIVLAAVSIIYLSWYSVEHSMDEARPFEINDPQLPQRVLIATQGSEFKEAVVQEVINRLRSQPVYIRIVDVSALTDIRENEWSAIVILHTWENWRPQKDAETFIDRAVLLEKIVMLSTSGGGLRKIEKIDGITAASEMNEVSARAAEIVAQINKILGKRLSFLPVRPPG